MPQLAGDGRGPELWPLLIREHEAPEQPLVQREHQKRWGYPSRCKDASELRHRLPQWEDWGRELKVAKGSAIDEETNVCTLDQLIPEDYRQSLDDHFELTTYAERLSFVKRKLGAAQHRALARSAAANPEAPVAMDVSLLTDADSSMTDDKIEEDHCRAPEAAGPP